jgi:hypothetical protein
MQNHGIIGSRSRFTGKPESRSRLEFYVYVFAMQETNRSNPSPSWPGIGQVARPCISQDVCQSFAGRCPRDQGPPTVLGASRLFVLLVAARRWVLAGNSTSIKAWGCPEAPLLHRQYQVTFQDTIFLLLHMLCVFLGASLFLLLVFLCFVCCNKWLDHIMFALERDTLRFSLPRTF